MSYEEFLEINVRIFFYKQYNWLVVDNNNLYYKKFNQVIINNNNK